MAKRYDRGPDDYGFGRRDPRDRFGNDPDRQRVSGQGGRYDEERWGSRQRQPWYDARNEQHHGERDQGRFERDYRGDFARDSDRNWERDEAPYRGNYSGSGRNQQSYYPSYSSERERDSFAQDRFERERGRGDRFWQGDAQRRGEREPGTDYRGIYQESVWTRDPSRGGVYGYEYTTRVDPRRFNQGDESQDRWRASEADHNRRFDIDRGWYTPGTSGYGNQGFQSQYGRGPKGYTRSDERIREDVCDRLSDDDEVDARDITVTVTSAEVILEGTVPDRRSKHRAEDIAESVSGVREVTNHLRARKGFFQELGDKISGDDDAEHHGHRGSGTRNSTTGTPGVGQQKTSH